MYKHYSDLYDEWAKFYDPENTEMQIMSSLVDFCGKNVLEIGCGTGRFTKRLSQVAEYILAIDNDIETVGYAIKNSLRKNIEYKWCDACSLDTLNIQNKFDIIVYSWSMNYISNRKKALQQALNCLKPDGKIIVMYTALGEYESLLKNVREDKRISDDGYMEIKKLFNIMQLDVVESKIVTPFVFPDFKTAMRLNEFFYTVDGADLTYEELRRLSEGLKKHMNKDGMICIPDMIKLLIGGKRCLN